MDVLICGGGIDRTGSGPRKSEGEVPKERAPEQYRKTFQAEITAFHKSSSKIGCYLGL
jgi:hypothetical protein